MLFNCFEPFQYLTISMWISKLKMSDLIRTLRFFINQNFFFKEETAIFNLIDCTKGVF